jgi:hypothetical protein
MEIDTFVKVARLFQIDKDLKVVKQSFALVNDLILVGIKNNITLKYFVSSNSKNFVK